MFILLSKKRNRGSKRLVYSLKRFMGLHLCIFDFTVYFLCLTAFLIGGLVMPYFVKYAFGFATNDPSSGCIYALTQAS